MVHAILHWKQNERTIECEVSIEAKWVLRWFWLFSSIPVSAFDMWLSMVINIWLSNAFAILSFEIHSLRFTVIRYRQFRWRFKPLSANWKILCFCTESARFQRDKCQTKEQKIEANKQIFWQKSGELFCIQSEKEKQEMVVRHCCKNIKPDSLRFFCFVNHRDKWILRRKKHKLLPFLVRSMLKNQMCNARTGQRKKVNAAEKEQLFHERDAIKLCFWSDVRIAAVVQMRESFYDCRLKRVLDGLLSHRPSY